MKKLFAIIIMITILLTVCAFAAESTDVCNANALYSLGLVKGYDDSGSDFRLENTLSRAESIVQIVRFLGAEQKALESDYDIPFTDVPDWALPYIGYAYEKKITSGISATAFGPSNTVSEAQFLTLLLRAMEYSDAEGDFLWSEPYTLAKSVGLVDRDTAKDSFLRGDAFTACYNALASKTKSGKTVSEKLVDANVITEKALGYAKRIADGETIKVACVGDSITEGHSSSNKSQYSYPAQLQKMLGQGFKVINCGKSSSYVMDPDSEFNVKKDTPELWYPNTAVYNTLMCSNPDVVIVMLGTNDARSMTDVAAKADFKAAYTNLVTDIVNLESKPEVYLSTMITAVNSFQTNQGTEVVLPKLIREVAEEMELPVIETGVALNDYYRVDLYFNDMVHPTDVSYPALATNFYNEVFGHSKENIAFQKAEGEVVFVSDRGRRDNDGKTPQTSVNSLGLAVHMLRETGGTVVVCAPLTVKATFLTECAAPVTVTSVYDGVDYRDTKRAGMTIKAGIVLWSDLTFENVDFKVEVNGQAITAQYNNLTIGEGVNCTGSYDLAINGGYRIACDALDPEDVSCYEDFTLSVASGRWALVRGGNMRGSAKSPIGTIKHPQENTVYMITVKISGGEFTNTGVNATSAVGMNDCEGYVTFEISGGTFAGNVYGIHRIGSTNGQESPGYDCIFNMRITGGTFTNKVGLFQDADAEKNEIREHLYVLDSVDLKKKVNMSEYEFVHTLDEKGKVIDSSGGLSKEQVKDFFNNVGK